MIDISVAAAHAACADAVLDGGESCDDGNTAGGDGCSALCRIEPANDFRCYRAKPKAGLLPFIPQTLTLADGFESSAMLFTGTKIDGQGAAEPDAQHVCYKGVGAPHRTTVGVEDRFGLHTLELSRADSLCLHSEP